MSDRLRIGVVGTPSYPIPPFNGYGGTQRGIYDFLVGLNKRGHELHLFGPGDSDVSGLENVTLHSYVPVSLWASGNDQPLAVKKELRGEHFRRTIDELSQMDRENPLDIINLRADNVELLEELVRQFGSQRIVYSLHNVRNQATVEKVNGLGVTSIAHCRSHKREHADLPNIHVITYGIDVGAYPYSSNTLLENDDLLSLPVLRDLRERGTDYLINLGAIGKHKGQKTCIRVAREVGLPIILAGTPQDRDGTTQFQDYHEREVLPEVDGAEVIYFGNANEREKKELLRHSRGFLFPSGYEDNTWTEPFGRAPVEALACGTPVVAYRKGSMEEVVFDGFNGFLFEDYDGALDAVNSLSRIERANVLSTAESKFDSDRVAGEYEQLFFDIRDSRV